MERPEMKKSVEVVKRERYEEFIAGITPVPREAISKKAIPAVPAIPGVRPAIPAVPAGYRPYVVPANIPVEVEYMPPVAVPPEVKKPTVAEAGKAVAVTGGGLFLLWLLSPLVP